MPRIHASRGLHPSYCLALCVFAFLAASALLLLWAPPHMAGGRRLPHEADDVDLIMPDPYHTHNLSREVWAGGSTADDSPALVEQVTTSPAATATATASRCSYAHVHEAPLIHFWGVFFSVHRRSEHC